MNVDSGECLSCFDRIGALLCIAVDRPAHRMNRIAADFMLLIPFCRFGAADRMDSIAVEAGLTSERYEICNAPKGRRGSADVVSHMDQYHQAACALTRKAAQHAAGRSASQ